MKSLPFGFLILIAVIIFALSGMNLLVLLNSRAIVLVILGTLGVFAISTPTTEIRGLIRALTRLRKPDFNDTLIHKSLISLSKNRNTRVFSKHPMITYAQELWEQGLDTRMFRLLLGQKLEKLGASTAQAIASMRNISKYPPALGMMGTVIGLVSLFSNLTPDNKAHLGPSLAMALTTTFFGLLLANFVLLPIADRLHVAHLASSKHNDHIFQILILIESGEPTSIIEEELNAAA